ncbi:MAG: substrate-binding domain-containing protein [Verrucomicrobiae bacterium]|nr:substrate-binding domain-containing protein [Verrucomicrobiae bacterium]
MKTNYNSVLLKWTSALVCALALTQANAQTVRLHGSAALAKTLEPQKAALESQSGVKLEIVSNGAGRGLADLSGGQAEIALLAGPLKGVAAAMNADKAGSVDIADMREIPLINVKIAFITHPSAGVKSLTDAQLRDVLTGKATNWKEVGGADLPIKLVLGFGADGSRVTVRETVLQGADYSKSMIVRNTSKDISMVIAQLPGSCSPLAVQNVEGNVTTVALEKEIFMPLELVVKGEPAGDIKKVIQAVTASVK